MKFLKLTFIFLCAVLVIKGRIVESFDRYSVIPKYINALIAQANEKDHLRTHDVAIIRLENEGKSQMFDDIVSEILKNSPSNPVLTNERAEIKKHRAHTASFIIIVSDSNDAVRKLFLVFTINT